LLVLQLDLFQQLMSDLQIRLKMFLLPMFFSLT
jgi:hypothetical protein